MTDSTDISIAKRESPVSAPSGSGAPVPKPKPTRTHARAMKRKAEKTDRAIRYRLAGATQVEAYTRAFRPRMEDRCTPQWACTFFNSVEVADRQDEICRMLRPYDLDNGGKLMSDINRTRAKAEADGNTTACVNYDRLRAQIGGHIIDKAVILQHGMSDAQLIDGLALDEAMTTALRARLATDHSFE